MPRARRALLLLTVVVALAVTTSACGSDDSNEPSAHLVEMASISFPTSMVQRPDTDEFWVAERAGRVHRLVRDGDRFEDDGIVLDLSAAVGKDYGLEGGFLGMTFAPDGEHLYVSYTKLVTNGGGNRLVAEFALDGDRVDEASQRILIDLEVEGFVHMGGSMVFGPDGYLYFGLGDAAPFIDGRNTGQRTDDLFASILRIDPTTRTGNRPYGIPADNPFADGGGAPEVWTYGVRNPWRFSFDRENGDLWIGDVGDNAWEEINHLPARDGSDAGRGANLGWSIFEGAHREEYRAKIDAPKDAIPPLYEWSHADGCAVIGGYVYRGQAIDGLQGQYLHGDLCQGMVSRLRLTEDGPQVEKVVDAAKIVSFTEDADGEIYVLTEEGVFALSNGASERD